MKIQNIYLIFKLLVLLEIRNIKLLNLLPTIFVSTVSLQPDSVNFPIADSQNLV